MPSSGIALARRLAPRPVVSFALLAAGLLMLSPSATRGAASRVAEAPPRHGSLDRADALMPALYLPWNGRWTSSLAPGTPISVLGGAMRVVVPLDPEGRRLAAGVGPRVVVFDSADTTPPEMPRLTWSCAPLTEEVRALFVEGDRLYVDMDFSIAIYDINNPAAPQFLHQWPMIGSIQAVESSVLYLWDDRGDITLILASDARRPEIGGTLGLVKSLESRGLGRFMSVSRGLAYLIRATEFGCTRGSCWDEHFVLEVFDVSHPRAPVKVFWMPETGWPRHIQRIGNHLLAGGQAYSLADPRHPVPVRTQAPVPEINKMASEGNALVVADWRSFSRYTIVTADETAFELRLDSTLPFDPLCIGESFAPPNVELNMRLAWMPGADGRLCTLRHDPTLGAPVQWVADNGPSASWPILPGRSYTLIRGSRGWLALSAAALRSSGVEDQAPIPLGWGGPEAWLRSVDIAAVRVDDTLYFTKTVYEQQAFVARFVACTLSATPALSCVGTLVDPDFPIEQMISDGRGLTTFGPLPGRSGEKGIALVDLGTPLAPVRRAFIPGEVTAFDRDGDRLYALRDCPGTWDWCLDAYTVDATWQVQRLAYGIRLVAGKTSGWPADREPALQVEAGIAYVRTVEALSVLDVSDPARPKLLAELPLGRRFPSDDLYRSPRPLRQCRGGGPRPRHEPA